jgi:SP family sugar:H+ symporter-like MFS transporter
MTTKNQSFFYSLFLSSVAAIGGFLFGYDSAVINGTVTAIQQAFGTSSVTSGFSVASMLLGCAVGAFFAGNVADRLGRKPVMFFTGLLFLISAFGSGIASGAFEFIIYRLLGGFAVGAASVLAPTYISEIAPARIRGRLASLQQLAIVVGIFSAFLVNYAIAKASGGASLPFLLGIPAWSWMFWSEIIPSFLFVILLFLIPESPRYLVSAKKDAEARHILSRLLPKGVVKNTLDEIRESLQREHKPRFSDIFKNGKILPIVWVGIALSVFQQFVGINVVFYYGSVLWQTAGFTESNALLINVLSGTINIVSTLVAIALIDKAGRKPLLLAGSIGMALTLGTLTVLFTLTQSSGGQIHMSPLQAVIALVAAHLYIFCFGVSWGPTVWVLLGEIFNNKIRGAAISTAASAQWVANFVITMTFPMLLAGFGLFAAYGLYTLFAILSIFFVLSFVKETKGKKLEEM